MAGQLTGGDLTLSTPGVWIEVDLDPDRLESIARLVAQGARGAPAIRSFGEEADAKSALVAATYWEPEETGAVAANLMLFAARREAIPRRGGRPGAGRPGDNSDRADDAGERNGQIGKAPSTLRRSRRARG